MCHSQRMLTKPPIKTFLQTDGDDLVDLDSRGRLPYTEIRGNLIFAWTTFQANLLPMVYIYINLHRAAQSSTAWIRGAEWCWSRVLQFLKVLGLLHQTRCSIQYAQSTECETHHIVYTYTRHKKDKVDHAPVWSIGGVLISLLVAVSP